MDPRLSVIIPAHNEELCLPVTIAAARQAGENWRRSCGADYEIIVVDNGSTDDTAEAAQREGVRVIFEPVLGIARARNAGAAAAHSSHFLFVDADTLVQPNLVQEVEGALRSGKVWGGSINLQQDSGSLGWKINFFMCNILAHFVNLRGGVFYCTREAFQAIQGFDETLDSLEDIRFFHQLRRVGRKSGRRFKHIASTYALTSSRRLKGKASKFFRENGLDLIKAFFKAVAAPRVPR